jgi:dihydrofolate reductase
MTPGGTPLISLIVAMDERRLIGVDGKLPWRLSEDLRYFKRTTLGHPVIVGRRTFEGLSAPLRDRRNIVLSRDPVFLPPAGVSVARSVEQALDLVSDAPEVFVAGGAAVYAAFLPRARRIYLTLVYGTYGGDTHFPPVDWEAWDLVWEQPGGQCMFRRYETRAA